MSRRIVQLTAASTATYEPGAGLSVDHQLYALDNNGVAWVLDQPGHPKSKWQRLPELPNVGAIPQPTFETPQHDKDGHDFPTTPVFEISNGARSTRIAPIGGDTE